MNNSLLVGAAACVCALAAASGAACQTKQDDVWTGPYVGANIGGAWGNTSLRASAVPGPGAVALPPGDAAQIGAVTNNSSPAGFAIGGELGYNQQFGHWVLGIETDGGFLDISQTRTHTFQSTQAVNPPVFFTLGQKVRTNWQWTLRPRVGYAWGPWLAYLTGGLGVTESEISAAYSDTRAPPNFGSFAFSTTRTGGVVGVGGGYMFAPGWSGKLEWLYSDYGHVAGSAPIGNNFGVFTSSANIRYNTLRAGVDYKF
jgi:outer membrane immunogenic protein